MTPRSLSTPESRMIASITWDPNTRVMEVLFRANQRRYTYRGVWPSDFAALCSAHSVGRAFNERIRGRYVGLPVREHEEGTHSSYG